MRFRMVAAAGLWLWLGAAYAGASPVLSPKARASAGVQQVIAGHVMTLYSDGRFHGERVVTHSQAVVMLARLAMSLEDHTWRSASSVAVPGRLFTKGDDTDWERGKLTRSTCAVILARVGDYVANGLPRPPADAQDLAKSSVLPHVEAGNLAPADPIAPYLTYLVKNRMVGPNSPLLKPDNRPILGGEMSRALAEMVYGLNDLLTPLTHNPDGSTPDVNDHKKAPGATK